MNKFLALFFLLLVQSCGKESIESTNVASANRSAITLSGNILWSADDSTGVAGVTVTLSGADSQVTTADSNGYYSFSTPNTGTFTITPVKNTNKLNGLSSADVTAIQRHVAAIDLFSTPEQYVQADVNKTNTISSLDASIINQALLGNPSALNQIKTSWRFAPTSYSLSTPPWGFPETISITTTTSQAGLDFVGMKTGDVDNSCNPHN